MAKIEPTTVPARWICGDETIDGITDIGEATGTNPDADVLFDYGERQFLATIKNKIGQYTKLPKAGEQCLGGALYRDSKIVICRKNHEKTAADTEDEPDNFIVDTGNVADPIYWTDNEAVTAGIVRTYATIDYRCIQSHTTDAALTPPNALGVLWSVA